MARLNLGWILSATLVGGAYLVGCGNDVGIPRGAVPGPGPDPGPDAVADNGFESDDPSGQSASNRGAPTADAGASAPPSGAASDSSGGAQRAVEEADIIKQEGNRLYALSRYGGLAVVDIADPDHMKLLGRKRTDGIPFEMYVRNGRAYVMLNDFGRYVRSDAQPYGQWIQGSEILAFDVGNPAAITEVAHFDVPGSISDSRLVGEALYLVTYENGYCYNCGTKPGTVVTSFKLAGTSIAKADQLAYTSPNANYSGWQRSVSATDKRLYIAGPEWNWSPGSQNASSIIQVVDITDPGGRLTKGAELPVAGQINSRWQMDESAGVLRVVSQHGNGWRGANGQVNPEVQTFTIQSSQVITPLGATELILPKPESLRSVRFDGTRGYAITAEQTDPLFTIDLSNPAQPKQAGQLEMPGWVFHMEPRGDRLVGFGYAGANPSAGLAVSLFDVSDLSKPSMIKRVEFGQGWGSFAEDQDRIHKSVRILDDQGLVLVPFASYGRWDGAGCSEPKSGIQLIDYGHDALALRGVAPQYGMPRRAFIANNRLLAVSDRNVTSFDIASRDAPAKKSELDLSNPAYRLVETANHVASISSDWWTGEVLLSLTPKATADDADVTGKISLAALATPNAATCASGGQAWASWYNARLFANGNFVYVTVPVYGYDAMKRTGKLVVAAIDIADPTKPRLASKGELKLSEHDTSNGYYGYYGYGFSDGYEYYSMYGGTSGSLVGSGNGIVQLGSKLAYLEVDHEPYRVDLGMGGFRYESKVRRYLHVVDFAAPAAPAIHPRIALGESNGAAPLHLVNGVVMTSRWAPSQTTPGKVRFFAERVDINGAAPVRLVAINTPGSLLLADEPSQRIVTTDYSATRSVTTDYATCERAYGYRAQFDYQTHECVLVTRAFKLADMVGTKVTLRQSFSPPSQNIGGVQIADDRIYVSRYARYDWSRGTTSSGSMPPLVEQGGLWAIGGIRQGQLSIVSSLDGDAQWPLAAYGTKVAIYTSGGLAIYDTATPVATKVSEANLRGYGYGSHVLLGANRAICSLGEWGLQTITY